MMKHLAIGLAVVGMAQLAWAADPSEAGVPTSPLTIYSGGIGAGASHSMNDELKAEQPNFLKLSFANSVFFRDNVSVFFDADWFLPGPNFGASLGFDFFLMKGDFRPFIGGGIGAHYFDKEKGKFGDNIGPSGTVHAGFVLDLTRSVQMRVRVPYLAVANGPEDHTVGLEVGFLFSNKFRNIKKLNYDRM